MISRKIIASTLVCVLLLVAGGGFFEKARAETKGQAKATIEVEEAVKQNSEFEVRIVYTGKSLARVKGTIRFNKDYFELVSGEVDDADYDRADFTAMGDIDGNIVLPLKFKALMGGTASMSLETRMAITMDEESVTVGKTSTDISIDGANENNVETKSLDEEPTSEDVVSEPTEDLPEVTGHPYIVYMVGIGIALLLLIIVLLVSKKKK